MIKQDNGIYDEYSHHDVTFNPKVIKSLGLVVDRILLKCGDVKLPCIIFSSSLVGSRILIKLSEEHHNYIKRKKGAVSLSFTFKDQIQKKEISFFVHSKVVSLSIYNESNPELYYCIIEFTNKAPDDLFNILGRYIFKQENRHKRAEERYIIHNNHKSSVCKNLHETIFFNSGKGKRCILTEISIFSAKLILVGHETEWIKGSSVMLIIKCREMEGIGEMLGHVERVELVSQEQSLYSVIIVFNQEFIPPTYKMWVSEFMEMVKG